MTQHQNGDTVKMFSRVDQWWIGHVISKAGKDTYHVIYPEPRTGRMMTVRWSGNKLEKYIRSNDDNDESGSTQ
jgi:hypothetical protein